MDKKILTEIYKQYSNAQINLENRRQSVNNWFVAFCGIIISKLIILSYSIELVIYSLIIILLIIVIMYYNKYLKAVNEIKFKQIDKMEKDLGYSLNIHEQQAIDKLRFTGSNYEITIFLFLILFIITMVFIKYRG